MMTILDKFRKRISARGWTWMPYLSVLTLHQRTLYGALALGCAITILFTLFLQGAPFFARAELSTYDWQITHRGAQLVPADIAVVAVDAGSIADLSAGHVPVPRAWMARAVTVLHRDGARAIGIDFLYPAPSLYGPSDDRALARAVNGAGNVVLGEALDLGAASNNIVASHTLTPSVPDVGKPAGQGLLNIPLDNDGLVRATDPMPDGPQRCAGASASCRTLLPVLPLELAAVALHRTAADLARTLPPSMLINYRGDLQAFPLYAFDSVARGLDAARLFRHKIVLIVPAAAVLKDSMQTPLGTQYGGMVQANALATILNHDPILPLGDLGNSLVLLLTGLLTTLAAARFGLWRSAGAVLGVAVLFTLATILLFGRFGIWVHLVTPLAAVVVIFAAIMALRFGTEERQRRKTGKIFGQYVKPEIVDLLVNAGDPEAALSGRRRAVSVLFVDIRGFTHMSEGMSPEDVLACLDVYLEDLTDSVQEFDGTLDKYVGDELMAIWNAPREQADHPLRVVRCALDMVGRMEGINARLQARGLPAITYGVGVNTGEAVVGQMGSSMRKQYTVIGDAVNTGARLCGAAAGGEVLIGEETWHAVGNLLVVEETEPLALKGKTRPLRTFRVLGETQEGQVRPDVVRGATNWEEQPSRG